MAFAQAEARRCGLVELQLYTNVPMHENLFWYDALGYRETHRTVQMEYVRVFSRKILPEVFHPKTRFKARSSERERGEH